MSNDAPGDPLTEAARWFVLLASGDATDSDRARWRAWLAADECNAAAWRRAETATTLFSSISREQVPASMQTLQRQSRLRRGRRRALGSLGVLFSAGLLGWQGWRTSDWSADLRTATGEQRDVTLADGSQLHLDTHTAVEIDFSAQARLIRLRRGRISIATAPAAGRILPPLMVRTAEGHVQALGTRFTVHQHADGTEVTVLEARVAILATSGTGTAPVLPAGQSAVFNRRGIVTQRAVRAGEDAWMRGMLIADDMPLADFIIELARYRSAPLVADPSLQNLRVSGTYPLADVDRALAALTDILPVRVVPLSTDKPAHGHGVIRTR